MEEHVKHLRYLITQNRLVEFSQMNYYKLCLVLLCTIFSLTFYSGSLLAQDHESLSADSLYILSKEAYKSGKYLEAANLNESAAKKIRSQTPIDEDFLRKVLGNLGLCAYHAGDNLRAVAVFREAYEMGVKLLGDTDVRAMGYRGTLAGALVNLRKYEEAVYLMRQLDETLTAEIEKGKPLEGRRQGNLNNLAVAYLEMGDYDLAEDLFLSAIKFREEINEAYGLGLAHYNLGDLHRRAGRLRQSLHHYSQAKRTWGKQEAARKPDRLYIHLLIRTANIEASLKNFVEAEEHLKLARQLITQVEFSRAEKSKFLINISIVYFSMGETSKAIDTAIDGLDEDVQENKNFTQFDILHRLVHYYIETGDLRSAEKYYNLGSGVLELERVSAFRTMIASGYHRSVFLLKSKRFNEVLRLAKRLDEKMNWQELVSAQGRPSMNRPVYLTGLMTNLALAKVAISRELPTRQGQIAGLDEGLGLLKKIDDYLSVLQFSDALEEDADWTKAFVGENYGAAVELCHELYQLTKNKDYLNQAFYYAERTKYWAVFQQWSERAAYGTEPEWKQEERNLRLRIFQLEQNIFASGSDANTSLLASFDATKTALEDRLYTIRDSIRRNDGGGSNSWLTQDIASLSSVEKSLGKNETLLSFFMDGDSYWLFYITHDETKLRQLPPDFSQKAKVFSQSISSPFLKGTEPDNDVLVLALEQYQNSGKWLMETIFPAGWDHLNKGRLIIIPSGEVESVPFAALPTKQITDLYQIGKYPYLMREVTITYGYSATLWQLSSQNIKKPSLKSHYLKALAPFEFGNYEKPIFWEPFGLYPKYTFKPLKNLTALKAIAEQINADVFTFPHALKEEILTDVEDYSILYLSTHSFLGDDQDGGPFLAFTRADTFSRSDFLYAREILQYQLPLDLVVLSSCASLSGNYVQGEGTYSLSRSFAYAGSRSVVATIWPIDDKSSAEVGGYFVGALKKGSRKDEALQEAQLQMLNKKDDIRNHPYFWAAFSHYGNGAPLW